MPGLVSWNMSPDEQEGIRMRRRWPLLFGCFLIIATTLLWIRLRFGANDARVMLDAAPPQRDFGVALRARDHVYREPRVNRLEWNISAKDIAPDGVVKRVIHINGKYFPKGTFLQPSCEIKSSVVFKRRILTSADQFPGPVVEARPGDTLEVQVLNQMPDQGTSIHWHGLHMRGANRMDGAAGLTQRAIAPGERFTYRFEIGNQTGTFWYHAHAEVQRGDGLYGGLVVHNPEEAVKLEQDEVSSQEEILLLVGDWYYRPAQEVLGAFMSAQSDGNEPCPDSLLVNGMGQFDCSMALASRPVHCRPAQRPSIQLNKGIQYRIRVVNVGSLAGISLSIPDANMRLIQLDGGHPVEAPVAHAVGTLYPAERMDLVVEWPASARKHATTLVIELDKENFQSPNLALTPTQSFSVNPHAAAAPSPPRASLPSGRTDLHRDVTAPRLSQPLPPPAKTFVLYSTIETLARHHNVPTGFINRTNWAPQRGGEPLVSLPRSRWDEHQLVPWTGDAPVWVDLVINNMDGAGHPYHLHGFDFHVLSSFQGNGGWPYFNPFDPSQAPRGGPFNVANPPRKDTVRVPPYGYVVLRFRADSPGIWMLHCHVLWHQAAGMGMALQVLGDEDGRFD